MSTAAAKKPAPAPPSNGASQPQPESGMATISQNFLKKVEREFSGQLGQTVTFTLAQQTLAQHLFIKVDRDLKALQAKGKDIGWHNVNMPDLSIKAVHCVLLGIDGMLKNHLHTIPYKNGAMSKSQGKDIYDLDLRIGYAGMIYSRVRASVEPIVDVVVKLVYETDRFEPIYKSATNKIESYNYSQGNPFNPGKPIGGFGYIAYEDPQKNKLVIVTQRDFDRSRNAGNREFWGWDRYEDPETGQVTEANEASRIEMMEKTVAHRTADAIQLDPDKINAASYEFMDIQAIDRAESEIAALAAREANGKVIDVSDQFVNQADGAPAVSAPQEAAKETAPPAATTDPREFGRAEARVAGAATYVDGSGDSRSTETGNMVEEKKAPEDDPGY